MSCSNGDISHKEKKTTNVFAVLQRILGIQWRNKKENKKRERENISRPKEVISGTSFADKLGPNLWLFAAIFEV